jgi:hypothetical protein
MGNKKLSRHPFKWMMYGGQKVRIDKEISNLLAGMWRLNIGTINSCQAVCSQHCSHKTKIKYSKSGEVLFDHNKTKSCYDRIWIAFDNSKSLERFLNIISKYEKTQEDKVNMYDLIVGCAGKNILKNGKFDYWKPDSNNWEYNYPLINQGVLMCERKIKNSFQNLGGPKYIYIWEEGACKNNNFKVQPQVTFPRKHLSYVEEKIKLFLKKKAKSK